MKSVNEQSLASAEWQEEIAEAMMMLMLSSIELSSVDSNDCLEYLGERLFFCSNDTVFFL